MHPFTVWWHRWKTGIVGGLIAFFCYEVCFGWVAYFGLTARLVQLDQRVTATLSAYDAALVDHLNKSVCPPPLLAAPVPDTHHRPAWARPKD